MLGLLRDTYRHRELIWMLALKELKVRYKRSALGFLWALLHPLLMTTVYVIVFSLFIPIGRFGIEHYPIFLLCAMFPFTFFQQSLDYAVQSFISNDSLIRKIYIPRMVFPLASVLANFMNLLFLLGMLAFFLWLFGHPFYATWAYLPVPLLGIALFTLGCSFFVATLGVFLYDIRHILDVFLRAHFFFSPVIYDLEYIDPRFHSFLIWNPMLYILRGFRQPLYAGELPSLESVVISVAVGVIALIVGYAFFRRFERNIALYI